MKKIQFFIIIIIIFTTGCATKKINSASLFSPYSYVVKQPPEFTGMPHGEVFFISGVKESKAFLKGIHKTGSPKDMPLGCIGYIGAQINSGIAREATAQCGGDRYIAANVEDSKTRFNVLIVRASPSLQRELFRQSTFKFDDAENLKPAPGSTQNNNSSESSLLLNDSTL